MNITASIIYSFFLFFGIFSYAGSALLFIQFKDQQKPYITSWIIGSILLGTATILVSLRDLAPEFIAYKMGNALNIAAYIYFYYSCVSLLGKRTDLNWVALKAFSTAIIFFLALFLVASNFGTQYQPALVALGGLVFNFYIGVLALRFYKQNSISLAYALTTIFFITALVWGTRCFLVLFGTLGIAFQGGQLILHLLCF